MDDTHKLRLNIYKSLLDLTTTDGINASGADEAYGCIFGRDSSVTILKLLNILKRSSASSYFDSIFFKKIIRANLLTLVALQGSQSNIESGEEPGKFIHEYRKDNFERLVNRPQPWYVYPDKKLRNYDSIDSTPMALVAIYKYWQITSDNEFLIKVLPAVEKGLNWMISYGDMDKDSLLEYELPLGRKSGGLSVQSWTDSRDSLLRKSGKFPAYPIAPVEVQGYAWLALRLWADFYMDKKLNFSRTEGFGRKLLATSKQMKKVFNKKFIIKDNNLYFAAQALDGYKRKIKTVTGNPLLLLWATYKENGQRESIIEEKYINDLVERSFQTDLFDDDGGIRTMSTKSPTFNPGVNSYHNGSFWPKLNGMAHEGLQNWGFESQADRLKEATLKPIAYFGTPMELYTKDNNGSYQNYVSNFGKLGCKHQAWTAAAVLDLLTN
ncbi:MAG TPA: amylo-alpha-1,6-glucosidase [Patescibacteria group bacterium]|nr:amylo-alpha-1,6-glucosidase [Patescibacteria group bacterium]